MGMLCVEPARHGSRGAWWGAGLDQGLGSSLEVKQMSVQPYIRTTSEA